VDWVEKSADMGDVDGGGRDEAEGVLSVARERRSAQDVGFSCVARSAKKGRSSARLVSPRAT
jgi:hypothetical protein